MQVDSAAARLPDCPHLQVKGFHFLEYMEGSGWRIKGLEGKWWWWGGGGGGGVISGLN